MNEIDFSKVPVDTLVDVELARVSEATRQAIIYVATRFFSHVDLSGDRCQVFKCFGGSEKIRISAKNPWLPWFGGECPVQSNCMVDVKYWKSGPSITGHGDAGDFDWNLISHYRLRESAWQTIEGEVL